jgi:hypothetical protein
MGGIPNSKSDSVNGEFIVCEKTQRRLRPNSEEKNETVPIFFLTT